MAPFRQNQATTTVVTRPVGFAILASTIALLIAWAPSSECAVHRTRRSAVTAWTAPTGESLLVLENLATGTAQFRYSLTRSDWPRLNLPFVGTLRLHGNALQMDGTSTGPVFVRLEQRVCAVRVSTLHLEGVTDGERKARIDRCELEFEFDLACPDGHKYSSVKGCVGTWTHGETQYYEQAISAASLDMARDAFPSRFLYR